MEKALKSQFKRVLLCLFLFLVLLNTTISTEYSIKTEKIKSTQMVMKTVSEEATRRAAYSNYDAYVLYVTDMKDIGISVSVLPVYMESIKSIKESMEYAKLKILGGADEDLQIQLLGENILSALNRREPNLPEEEKASEANEEKEAETKICNNNLTCDEDEDYFSCSIDCLSEEGQDFCAKIKDGFCDPKCRNDIDCYCGDNVCQYFETYITCSNDCLLKSKNYLCSVLSDSYCDDSCIPHDVDCGRGEEPLKTLDMITGGAQVGFKKQESHKILILGLTLILGFLALLLGFLLVKAKQI